MLVTLIDIILANLTQECENQTSLNASFVVNHRAPKSTDQMPYGTPGLMRVYTLKKYSSVSTLHHVLISEVSARTRTTSAALLLFRKN